VVGRTSMVKTISPQWPLQSKKEGLDSFEELSQLLLLIVILHLKRITT
jgi:hypothetical protein